MKKISFLPEHFKEIALHLKRGGIVIFPTESSYGFSGDLSFSRGIQRVEYIKQRKNKSFLCLVSHFSEMEKWAETKYIPEKFLEEAKKNPCTFVLPKKKIFQETFPNFFPEFLKVGIRKTLYKPLEGFLQFYGDPIFSTSANISGEFPLYSEKKIQEKFSQYRDLLFVSAGNLLENSPSKIIDVEKDALKILRK